jgi:hypothetical protein
MSLTQVVSCTGWRTFADSAEKAGSEPRVTDAARGTNVRSLSPAKNDRFWRIGSGKGFMSGARALQAQDHSS